MDEKMLKCGGEAMRKQLISQMEELSLADKAKWTSKDEEMQSMETICKLRN
jgi:hypothetical protein